MNILKEFLILCFCLQACSHHPFLVKWPEQQQLLKQKFKFEHPNLSESATAYPVKGDDKLLGSYQVSSEIREGPMWKEMCGTNEIVTGGKTGNGANGQKQKRWVWHRLLFMPWHQKFCVNSLGPAPAVTGQVWQEGTHSRGRGALAGGKEQQNTQ